MTIQKDDFVPDWLDRQCEQFRSPIRAAVLLGEPDSGPFQPVAQWPDESAAVSLAHAGLDAIRNRTSVIRSKRPDQADEDQVGDILACPILRKDHLLGVVAVEVQSGDPVEQQKQLEVLQATTNSLEELIRQTPDVDDGQSFLVLDLLAASIEHADYASAARAVTTKLAAMLGYERVSLGWIEGQKTRIDVHSGSATVNPKMLLARTMAAAMDESIESDEIIRFPAEGTTPRRPAHEKFMKLVDGSFFCTVPISYAGELQGAFLFEKTGKNAIEASELSLAEAAAALIGPVLYEKRLRARSISKEIISRLKGENTVKPGSPVRYKWLWAAIAVLLFSALSLLPGDYRITADAALEGTVQRMVVAPVEGYIAEANVRAGDIVREGDLLARLEDKEYELERLSWQGEQHQLQREYREAMAQYDSAQVAIVKAKLDSASAKLTLAERNLARTRVIAPMDGVLVRGDLDQSLGAPVERGELLFELAPLDAYRVMLEVDERDIGRVQSGQTGSLALVGMPGQRFEFKIERTTPVSTAKDGRNYFLVEASLGATENVLRPGMEGVGKIEIGQQKLIWIYTHEILEWFRLWAWKWLP